MKMIVAGLVLAVGLAVTPALAAPVVHGFGPYVLGAKATDVLKTGGFRHSVDDSIPASAGVTVYVKEIKAPLAGSVYSAALKLYIWRGTVGAFMVVWRGTEFDTVGEWQEAYHGLYNQLVKTYGANVVAPAVGEGSTGLPALTVDDPGDDGMAYHFTDSAGNKVSTVTSTDDHFDISLMYQSAAFQKMLSQTPKPAIKY
jgi:hypothetical protein